jgi:general secretion pathway protein L
MSIPDAIDTQLARLRTRYARTPLPRFFAWWGRELVSLLPERWRAQLAERTDALLLEAQGGELVAWRQSGERTRELARISLAEPIDVQKAAFARLRNQLDDPDLRRFYCIAPERTLRRHINLPAAAENNLRQVLAFEMDRQTPFKADQVYFDYRVSVAPGSERTLSIELTVVPRAQLDNELVKITGVDASLDGVDCWQNGSGSQRAGLNLLPQDRRIKRKNVGLRINLALAGAAAILLITVMLQSLANRQSALEAMTAEVEKAQNDAKQVSQLRKTMQDTIDSANFLSRKKHESPLMVDLLNDLTVRLPDDTYLERLNVDEKNKIELQGLSDDASKLIGLLSKSDLLTNPSVQGTIQPDPRTKKDRFNITLEFRSVAAAEAAAKANDARDRGAHKPGGGKNAPDAGNP